MKQFFVTSNGRQNNWSNKTEDEWMALGQKRSQWTPKLGDNYISGKLAPKAHVVLQMKAGKIEVTEPAFNDNNEDAISGFFVIDAENMDHAVELMKGCPWLQHDRIEIYEAEL
jgi:hypothetical protein